MSDAKKASIFGGEQILFLRLKKHKDKQAFVEAYDLYVDQIFRFIYFKVGNKEEAEDLVSMVFLKCWNYIYEGHLGDYQTLKALLYKIARNTVIDHYRKSSKRQDLALEEVSESVAVIDEKQNPENEAAVNIDFQKLMEEKLPQLKDEYREVIVLRFINELSIAEISKVLGKTSGNVRVMIHRALDSLQHLVKDEPAS